MWGWGAFRQDIPICPSIDLELEPVDQNFTDGVRRYYGQSRFEPATGVTVGVIDTGVGPHDDLNIIGGLNVVSGEPGQNYEDLHRARHLRRRAYRLSWYPLSQVAWDCSRGPDSIIQDFREGVNASNCATLLMR